MKRIINLLILGALFSNSVFSQQVIGGDITWTCINTGPDAGKYKFRLTLFNQCAQGSLPNTQNISVYNNPTISTISVNLDSEKDISPICYDPAQQASCDSLSPNATSMAIYYSTPISFSGIPPVNGWGFTWTSNSRNITSSNLSALGGTGYTLHSVMYNFKNTNANTCFDNSPQFISSPIINYCTGYSLNISNYSYDPDNDQVSHSWSVPMGASSSFPPNAAMTWEPGYSTFSPFPGTFFSPNNVPPSLSSINGTINFTTHVTADDRIYYAVKIQSVRDSMVISEVYRQMMAAPKACPPTPTIPPIANTPPVVTFKQPGSPVNRPLPVFDTVYAGDTVNINITSTDAQFLPTFIGQTNYAYLKGSQFGLNYSNSSFGCDRPPCATINSFSYDSTNNRFSGLWGIVLDFEWVTDSIHGSVEGNWYHFHYYVLDNWCPQPGVNVQTHSILVLDKPTNSITGNVFNDYNNNGLKDTIEPLMTNIFIRQSPPVYYTATQNNGYYNLPAYSKTYSLNVIPPRYYQITKPSGSSYSVTTSGNGNTYSGYDFGLYAPPNINDLYVDITQHVLLRPGWPTAYWLTIGNIGTSTLSGSLSFEFPSLLQYTSSNPTASNIGSNSLTWNYTNLSPGNTYHHQAIFLVDTSANTGDTVFVKGDVYPIVGDTLPEDNKDSLLKIVINSYDPNYKAVEPNRDLYVHEIKNQNFIYYTIYFQNTGAAPAIDVKIIDEIETELNIEKIELISSSHNYSFRVNGRKLTWNFNNINLPDSGSDWFGSLGFVKFRIIADTALNIGDSITNAVEIYFDFNPPIYSKAVSFIVAEDTTVGLNELHTFNSIGKTNLKLFPNPFINKTQLMLNSPIDEDVLIQVFTITGNETIKINSEIINSKLDLELNLNHLKNGIYFVRVSSDSFSISSKLIKQ